MATTTEIIPGRSPQGVAPLGINYRDQPLGSLPGEQGLAVPYNQPRTTVIVRVRNLSATLKRAIVREYVSIRRGGQEMLADNEGRKRFGGNAVSPEVLHQRVAQGDNMNWVENRVSPIDFRIRHDNMPYTIHAVDPVTGENAPWYVVAPGVWDLYMGNWDRMHSRDPRDKTREIEMLITRGLNRWVATEGNPYGILEFERQEVRIEQEAIDPALISSGHLIEV